MCFDNPNINNYGLLEERILNSRLDIVQVLMNQMIRYIQQMFFIVIGKFFQTIGILR